MSIWKNGMGKQQVYNRMVWGNGSHHQQQQIDIYNQSLNLNLNLNLNLSRDKDKTIKQRNA